MDCLTARSALEVSPAGHPAGPDAVQAAEHVAACPECQAALAAREAFDRRVAAVVQDVAVPPGLKERILARLEEAARSAPAAPTPGSGRRSRWRWLAAAAALIVIAVGGVALRTLNAPPPPIAFEQLAGQMTTVAEHGSLPPLPAFASGVQASPPRASRALAAYVKGSPRKLTLWERQEVGMWFFKVPARASRRTMIPARLAVAPRGAVRSSNAAPGTHGPWSLASWDEGDLFYTLAIEGPESELRRFMPQAM